MLNFGGLCKLNVVIFGARGTKDLSKEKSRWICFFVFKGTNWTVNSDSWCFVCLQIRDLTKDPWITLPETNIATENRPSQKETIVFQPSIFRCYVSSQEGVFYTKFRKFLWKNSLGSVPQWFFSRDGRDNRKHHESSAGWISEIDDLSIEE